MILYIFFFNIKLGDIMKEYEISVNNKTKGKVKIFKDNLNKDIKNSLITSNKEYNYNVVDYKEDLKQYEVSFVISDVDELYDIVSKYTYNNEIFNVIEEIKEYNNLKTIKKNTLVNIIIPEIYLNNLNINKNNIDKESLLESKMFFVNKVSNELNIEDKSRLIKENYINYRNSKEYDFLTDKEKINYVDKYLNELDIIIKDIENKSNYKYGKDFIIPIKINNVD